MASRSSSFCSGARPFTGVESVDWDPEDRGCHVKLTGIKFFNLHRGIRRGAEYAVIDLQDRMWWITTTTGCLNLDVCE
jgi:hypothetical protein